MGALDSAVRTASSAGGQALRVATRLVALRPAAKPLHPRGSLVSGTLHRFGTEEHTGATWLDQTGEDEVVVRLSRAVGLPAPVPDVFGLALRVPTGPGRYGDLLFASTGLGRLTRFVLTPAGSLEGRPLTTLLPCRTPAGPVLLAAVPEGGNRWGLSWALGSGAWHRFADLVLDDDPAAGDEPRLSFDPVGHELPGLRTYPWVRRLREPSYRTARSSRGG